MAVALLTLPGEQRPAFQVKEPLVGSGGVLLATLLVCVPSTGERNNDQVFREVLGNCLKIVGEAEREVKEQRADLSAGLCWFSWAHFKSVMAL